MPLLCIRYAADHAHAAILSVEQSESQPIVKVYEDKPFKGPHSIVFDSTGNMYFTDSGPFGETGLQNPTGSCFCVTASQEGQILKPLALNSLAYPTGLALSPDERMVYVCEMATNRLLRFFQKPTGVFHYSVFCQFSGGVGPSSVAVDEAGNIYVGHYDLGAGNGRISVVSSSDGQVVRELSVPGPEVTGLAISPDNSLLVTEASTRCIYRVEL